MSLFAEWQNELHEIADDFEVPILASQQWRVRFDAGLSPLDAFFKEYPELEDDHK